MNISIEKECNSVKEGAQRSQYRRCAESRPGVGYRSVIEGPWDGCVITVPEAACQLVQQVQRLRESAA